MPVQDNQKERDESNSKTNTEERAQKSRRPFLWITLLLIGFVVLTEMRSSRDGQEIAYSKFLSYLEQNRLTTVEVRDDHIAGFCVTDEAFKSGVSADSLRNSIDQNEKPQTASDRPGSLFVFRTAKVEDDDLIKRLQDAGVEFGGVIPSALSRLMPVLLPVAIIILIFFLLSRRVTNVSGGLFNVRKSRARLVGEKETGVSFSDVAGCDESKAELEEVVDFLKHPDRYRDLGASIPRGVLLVGPPGTGKTLLAKAVAGEADVPFFQLSGSDFVEMFVGVGAARVRDLFAQARSKSPCIVFIDELDAIGRARGVNVSMGANEEREQTLNQLLVEMDGFDSTTNVILLAATNRPEILDKALLRPGRFDRQVLVDLPDVDGREAILKVHSRDKRLGNGVDLRALSRGTAGFSGADLANIINESALLAARHNSGMITQGDLEEAVERIIAGPERRGRRMDPREKRRVAFHEVGHAMVIATSESGDPVHKISVVPRGRAALGYTLQLPDDEQFLKTESQLFDRIKGLLGGRAAEDVVFGDVSTGSQNDLERATDLARDMVCRFGMSDTVGLMNCANRTQSFLESGGTVAKDCSEKTAREVDEEVRELLNRAYGAAKDYLISALPLLYTISEELLELEVIDGRRFAELLREAESCSIVKQPETADNA